MSLWCFAYTTTLLIKQENDRVWERKRDRYALQLSLWLFFSCSSFVWTCWRPINTVLHIWQQEPPPIHPTYGTSDMQTKSGFCAINGNCLMEEHMVKKKMKKNVISPHCSFVQSALSTLNPHRLFIFLNKSKCNNSLSNPPEYWRKSAGRVGCQSVLSTLT